jgi:hypothetical protein
MMSLQSWPGNGFHNTANMLKFITREESESVP